MSAERGRDLEKSHTDREFVEKLRRPTDRDSVCVERPDVDISRPALA